MRIRAAESGEMAGSDDPVFVSEGQDMYSATVTVYRLTQGQRFAYTATARWAEYKPEQNDFMWRKMKHTMLGKCAEALALRKGFPRQLAGLYAKEEMDQADSQSPVVAAVASPSRDVANPSAPNGGDSGISDDGPDLGVDLPPGTVRVTAIGTGPAGSRGEITFSDGTVYLTWDADVMRIARNALPNRTPVTVEFKMSAAGNTRISKLTPVQAIPPVGVEQAF
jgi:hypothetical protein